MDPLIAPHRPDLGSGILTRADSEGPAELDKLILAPSREPGAPFIMADLYARGAHAHENQPGALVYYESHDAPMLASLGYNNRNPEYANLTVMQDSMREFPFVPGLFQPGVWHEARLATALMPVVSEDKPSLRHLADLVLRVSAGKNGVELATGPITLIGLDGRTMPVEPMDEPMRWIGDGHLVPAKVPGPSESPALEWKLPKGVTFLNRKAVNIDFDSQQYPYICLPWKLSNNDEPAHALILREGFDYKVCIPQLHPHLVSAETGVSNGVQLGCMSYAGWFTPQSTLTRQMALFPDGLLIVRDVLVPGADAIGQTAGQVWHFLPRTKPEAGANWFNSMGAKADLLIVLNRTAQRAFGNAAIDVWSKTDQQSIFAREAVHPAEAMIFDAVLWPHAPGIAAADLASGVEITDESGVTQIRIKSAGGSRLIEIHEGLSWKIHHT